MAERSRRSFFVDLLSTLAGGWVTVTGLVTAASALGGCSNNAEKYGGLPPPDGGQQDGMATKYGGLCDGGQRDGMATKYGGLCDGGQQDLGPVAKYGGVCDGGQKDLGPVAKYGGVCDGGYKDGAMTTKYGGINPG
jgi:hypothetical protein